MTVFRIDPAEIKTIIEQTFDRLHHVVREANAMGWHVTRIYSPGKFAMTIPLDDLPRYAPPDEEALLHERIRRHVERMTTETQTRILTCEVDIERGTLGLYVQVNDNLVSAAIDQAEAYDKRRQSDE
jgi:hypothetical protein